MPGYNSNLRFGYLLNHSDDLIREYGGYDEVPLDQVKVFLDLAAEWASADDDVRIKWRGYLKRRWGPIETVQDVKDLED